MVAVEKRNGQGGRIRLRHIKDLSEQSIVHFIKDSVEEGATIRTNKFKSYSNLNLRRYGYALQPIIRGKTGREPSFVLVDSVISDLKRWIRDIFHGVSKKHLQSYLNEYAFIYNRRFNPPVEFHTLLGLSFRDRVPTYRDLYDGTWTHPTSRSTIG